MQKTTFILGSLVMLMGCSQPQNQPSTPEQPTQQVSQTSDSQRIKIATESSFVPFSYKDANGNLLGFEIDLANALCQEVKVECDIISQDFDGLITGLQAKKYDAIMAGMSITEDRSKVVSFSKPYFDNQLIIIGKKGVDKGADDLAGKTVAVQRSTMGADYLAQHFPKATAKLYDSQDNAYLDLEAGRADLMISDIAPAKYWLTTDKGQNFEVKGNSMDVNDKIAIAFRQNDPLMDKFNMALNTLKANGSYHKIAQTYNLDVK